MPKCSASFSVAGHIDAPYAMPNETNKPIYVLRGMKMPLARFWPTVKNYELGAFHSVGRHPDHMPHALALVGAGLDFLHREMRPVAGAG